jgi:3-hydroxybutyryl-CoA dehydrogenase
VSATRPDTLGVVGAGTMGAGIAQLAAQSGARCLLHDPDADALSRGLESARGRIERGIEKGRLQREDIGSLEGAAGLPALAGAELVIEAAPEDLELKRELFAEVARHVAAQVERQRPVHDERDRYSAKRRG